MSLGCLFGEMQGFSARLSFDTILTKRFHRRPNQPWPKNYLWLKESHSRNTLRVKLRCKPRQSIRNGILAKFVTFADSRVCLPRLLRGSTAAMAVARGRPFWHKNFLLRGVRKKNFPTIWQMPQRLRFKYIYIKIFFDTGAQYIMLNFTSRTSCFTTFIGKSSMGLTLRREKIRSFHFRVGLG